jgi:glycosyltransferase involved in cell wall biosynthesis
MKIAIYHNLLSGGAKRAIHELVQRLAGRHEFHVFSLSCSNHEFADLRPLVAKYHVLPFQPLPLFESPLGRLNPIQRLRDLARLEALNHQIAAQIDAGGFDLAFVQPCQTENSPSLLRFLRYTPGLFFCQEPLRLLYETMPTRPYDRKESTRRRTLNRIDPLPPLFRRRLGQRDRANLRAARQVLVNSHFVRGNVERIYGVSPTVQYLGVDVDLFRPLELPRQDFVLSVGSLTPLKGFDFIVRALGQVPLSLRPPLVIASNFQNPPERDFLQGLAAEQGVQLTLEGNISDERLVQLYNQAALTLYAPIREPFGLVALESLACGTPLVAVREGGVQETVLDGQVGLLTARDESAFAAAVEQLLTQPERRAEMGQAGQAHIRRQWTWDRSATCLDEIFHALAQPSPAQPAGVQP